MHPATQLSPLPAAAPAPEAPRQTACWVALDFPLLALEALSIQATDRAVVSESYRRGAVVYQVSDLARSMGISPGLDINAAMAVCTGLNIYPRDTRAEYQRLQKCKRWASRFTPMVCLEPPTTVLLEVAASLKLFGGLEALCEQLHHDLNRSGQRYFLAVTPTPAASAVLARAGREVRIMGKADLRTGLAELPLTSLGLTADTVHNIKAVGIDSLYELWRLPRHDTARRFGPEVIRRIDCLLGACPDPRRADSSPLDFRCRHDLQEGTGDMTLLLSVARSLLARLVKFLRRVDAVAKEIYIALYHDERSVTHIKVGTRLPTHNLHQWGRLLSEHMQGYRLQAPVVRIDLLSERLLPNDAVTLDLYCGDPARDWARSLDELEARLGKNCVWMPKLTADHRPEYAWHRSNHDHAGDLPSRAQRPLWLLSKPQPLRCRAGRIWRTGPLHLIAGPERIESGWWDDRECCRDYYTATSTQDGRLWIFQDLKQKHSWYLHGLFG